MKIAGLSLIGEGHGATGGKTFTGINPADGAPLPVEFHSASNTEVTAAAELAATAFLTYARWSGAQRAALLNRIAELLETNGAEIVTRAQLETGLPAARLQGELVRTCFQIRQYGQAAASGLVTGIRIDHADPDRKPAPKPDLRSLLVPLGPVAVFGASNFPLAYSVAGGDTASALAAGCPVIVKAHPAHPGTSELVGGAIQQAARECGAPVGTFSLLFDAGHEVGVALVKHPLIKATGFTGSRRGGRVLMDLAAARPEPIPVYAEMSSINPVCILAGALRERAGEIATGLHASVMLGVGQFCTKPGLILVEAGVGAGIEPGTGADAFLAKLATLTTEATAATMLTPGICAAYRSGAETFSRSAGVNCLARPAEGSGPASAGAALFETNAAVFLANRGLMEEIFGPATLVVKCSSAAQILEVVGRLEGQLTATLHATQEELTANEDLVFALGTKAGRLVYNGFPTGVEVAHAMTHGGPYPATSDGRSTSVGTRAIERFQRPLTFQGFPDAALPPELQEANPLGFARLCDGAVKTAAALCLLFFFTLALATASNFSAMQTNPQADTPREHLSLDSNWKFHLGDDWPDALDLSKAAASTGPAAAGYDDDAWRAVNLPHDFAVELPFDKSADVSHGFKALGPGFETNSIGWYRRTFELPAGDSGKRIWLTFDGVYRDATVWFNGWLIRRHESGYYPFREDITDLVKFGGKNTIAVRVDATKFEGWFYEGAGIYRHVWLDETAPTAIAPDGIFVSPRFKDNLPAGSPKIAVEVSVINTETNATRATVKCEVFSPAGEWVKSFSQSGRLEANSHSTIRLASKISSPVLWSPESPKLYRLVTMIETGGKTVDRLETEFGIRTVAFDKDKGFLLNGRPYEIKGTCNHQDHAGVGEALPDALQYFRISKLKEFGCNAYRCAHNPPTPELLEACDRLGMLVMDENRLLGSDSQNLARLAELVRRDRNHPSVAIWSIANEEHAVQASPDGGHVGASMQRVIKELDPTRPVTAAEVIGNVYAGLMSALEVRGWNYWVGKDMDRYHAEHPDQPNVGTETASTVCTRGIYQNDPQRGYVSAYDENFPGWATTAERWWSFYAVRPWLSGGFAWTGFDYRGEPTPYAWPCINSHFGILDTCGFPKDNYWYYQSWWTTNVVLHLLPHWNWPGKEGQEIRVDALSNCREVELFLNGASLGKQSMQPNSKLTWQVKYAPGTLSAKGYDTAGQITAETKIETTGEASQIQLTPDRQIINADGEDVSVLTVTALDAKGRVVPVAMNLINFAMEGPGKIIGVGNGDPSCHEPDVFVPQVPVRAIPVAGWRWQSGDYATLKSEKTPEFLPEFDDSNWKTIKTQTDGDTGELPLKENESAFYRAHIKLTQEDLDNPGVLLRFASIDDEGWVYVNGQRVGESHDWQDTPSFNVKQVLHPGDNVIAVGVRNYGGPGGVNPDVTVRIVSRPTGMAWSRSLFNGLAQIIVQSTKEAGEIKLTASSNGLKPATAIINTVAGPARPSVP